MVISAAMSMLTSNPRMLPSLGTLEVIQCCDLFREKEWEMETINWPISILHFTVGRLKSTFKDRFSELKNEMQSSISKSKSINVSNKHKV